MTACEAATVKPESATACSIIFSGEAAGAKAGSQEHHQKHLEEIREVATIGLTHICNHKHVPLLEAQLQVRVPNHPSAGKLSSCVACAGALCPTMAFGIRSHSTVPQAAGDIAFHLLLASSDLEMCRYLA